MRLKDILTDSGFKFSKRFGQNFISDENLLASIVEKAGVTDEDTVIEIGCGAGTLTAAIAEKAKRVIGFEIDKSLAPVLKKTVGGYENAEIIFSDIMKIPTEEIESLAGGEYKIVANLPYYITTPVLMKFIEEGKKVASVCVMVQSEVADRLCASAGSAEYGAITAAVDFVGSAEKVLFVGRNNFYPVPKVDSAVVRIDIDRKKHEGADPKAYRAAVRCAFLSRRKTLVNNIMQSYGFSREKAENIVLSVSDDPKVRGETLSTEEFIRLSLLLK